MKRIQRKRTKGWRMPKNTVYVGRPSIFGNPHSSGDKESDVLKFKFAVQFEIESLRCGIPPALNYGYARKIAENLDKLKGKNLACWCGPNERCHADALLEIMNEL